MIEPES
jgi:hypothetical protein